MIQQHAVIGSLQHCREAFQWTRDLAVVRVRKRPSLSNTGIRRGRVVALQGTQLNLDDVARLERPIGLPHVPRDYARHDDQQRCQAPYRGQKKSDKRGNHPITFRCDADADAPKKSKIDYSRRTQGPTKTKGHGKISYPAAPALGRATCCPYLPPSSAYNRRYPPPVLAPTVAGFSASPSYNSPRSHTYKAKSNLFCLRKTPSGTKPSSGSPMARMSQCQITSPSTQCLPSRSSISITQRSGSRSVWRAI